uniref:Uncharacterized protein n=1 Tax=Glossina palpalis gambiensis TaxID=67801 RepID=A0A1B0BUN4_9MUSC
MHSYDRTLASILTSSSKLNSYILPVFLVGVMLLLTTVFAEVEGLILICGPTFIRALAFNRGWGFFRFTLRDVDAKGECCFGEAVLLTDVRTSLDLSFMGGEIISVFAVDFAALLGMGPTSAVFFTLKSMSPIVLAFKAFK